MSVRDVVSTDDDEDDILGTPGTGPVLRTKRKRLRRPGTCLWMMVGQT
jgi:hypothetical protein